VSAELVALLRKAAAELRDLQSQAKQSQPVAADGQTELRNSGNLQATPLQQEKAEILHDFEMDRQQRVAA
jgi:hypothetical protein